MAQILERGGGVNCMDSKESRISAVSLSWKFVAVLTIYVQNGEGERKEKDRFLAH